MILGKNLIKKTICNKVTERNLKIREDTERNKKIMAARLCLALLGLLKAK